MRHHDLYVQIFFYKELHDNHHHRRHRHCHVHHHRHRHVHHHRHRHVHHHRRLHRRRHLIITWVQLKRINIARQKCIRKCSSREIRNFCVFVFPPHVPAEASLSWLPLPSNKAFRSQLPWRPPIQPTICDVPAQGVLSSMPHCYCCY